MQFWFVTSEFRIRALNDALFIGSIIDGLMTLTFNSEVLSRIVIACTWIESAAIIEMIIIENFILHSFSLSASTFIGFKKDSSEKLISWVTLYDSHDMMHLIWVKFFESFLCNQPFQTTVIRGLTQGNDFRNVLIRPKYLLRWQYFTGQLPSILAIWRFAQKVPLASILKNFTFFLIPICKSTHFKI